MTSQFQRTGLPCTILFVDVCGSTQIYETLGNARAQAVIAKSLGTAFNPVNKICVRSAVVEELERRRAAADIEKHART